MTAADIIQILVSLVVGSGVTGAIVTIWTSRHKPAIERQAANDATRKSYAETFKSEVETMKGIIAELRTERDEDRKVASERIAREEATTTRLSSELVELRTRVEGAEERARKYERRAHQAIAHIAVLEDHINNKLPPPPPERPEL